VDTFTRDHLPPLDRWPDLLLDRPEFHYPEYLNAAVELTDRMVAKGFGDHVALIGNGRQRTYKELTDWTNRLAHSLVEDFGVKPGNRVLIRSGNNPAMVAVWLAVTKAGAVAVNTMPLLRAGELTAIINKAEIGLALCERIQPHLDSGRPALTARLSDEERTVLNGFFLLTSKPTILACNVGENDLAQSDNAHIRAVREFTAAQNAEVIGSANLRVEAVVISAQIESELTELTPDEAREFLSDLGVADSGVSQLIRAVYHLLGLRTYLTTGPKETRAWTIHAGDKAPAAAGVIHSDFERGFIAAQTIAFEDLVSLGSEAKAREAGKLRVEGKDYEVRDGEVCHFRFNVAK
jgi:hypothetical protein